MPNTKAETKAKVLVYAKGPNNLPSCASIMKTGKKLMIVVSIAVDKAPDTSATAVEIKFTKAFPRLSTPLAFSSSIWRSMLSIKTIPTSTMTPMAMAIPERATIFASTPICFMMIKVTSTPMGRILDMRMDARRLITNTMTTIIQISIS